MLVLSRKAGEQIVIGDQIRVTVVKVHGGRVRLGIEAPKDVSINRQERENRQTPAREEEIEDGRGN